MVKSGMVFCGVCGKFDKGREEVDRSHEWGGGLVKKGSRKVYTVELVLSDHQVASCIAGLCLKVDPTIRYCDPTKWSL